MSTALAAPPEPPPTLTPDRRWADRLAPLYFWLAFVYLVALAGLIHRADRTAHVTGVELWIMFGTIVGLWPVFVTEAVVSFFRRDRGRRWGPMLARVVAVALFPPARMGLVHPATGMVWLPRLGWQRQGKELLARLERGFGLPLLLFALLVLPVLGIEYVWADRVKQSPAFAAVLHACMAVIWVAFAAEFVIKLEASGRPFKYAKEKWLDAAIVLLPVFEFALTWWANASLVARLLRTVNAIAPDKLARLGQVYRLRGLLMKGWHALLALELFARLLGDNPKKRLARLEAQVAVTEEELAVLRRQVEQLRAKVAADLDPPAE